MEEYGKMLRRLTSHPNYGLELAKKLEVQPGTGMEYDSKNSYIIGNK